MTKCEALIRTGKNKGQQCNCKKKTDKYCGKHKKYSLIKIITLVKSNNETIGITLEYVWCIESNIVCNYELHRINMDYVNKFRPIVKQFLSENPKLVAIRHIGDSNGDIDFEVQDNKPMSLKTLKKNDGKICPQNIGQPSYKSFDRIWSLKYEGKYEHNSKRLEYINTNINMFLNKMLKNLFICDFEIVGYNCEESIRIDVLKKPENMNYFDGKTITLTQPNYNEGWSEEKQKYNEYSSRVLIGELQVGELQFHKITKDQSGKRLSGREVIKFRFC